MKLRQKDIKLIWGRAGNRCSICRIELSQDAASIDSAYALGEQAHIVGENEGSARWSGSLPPEEKNSYHNIILLCPTHHREVDKNEADWPVERLYVAKSRHEQWVKETLADSTDLESQARQLVLTSIVDKAVALCGLEDWETWTSRSLDADPTWGLNAPDKLFEFRKQVAKAIWPDESDELQRSTVTLSILLHNACSHFMEHADLHGDRYLPHKFYKTGGLFNPNYDEDLIAYTQWLRECHSLVIQSTKAANWFAEVVRRDINPLFFVEHGKFSVLAGPYEDLQFYASIPEFTQQEKDSFPEGLMASSDVEGETSGDQ